MYVTSISEGGGSPVEISISKEGQRRLCESSDEHVREHIEALRIVNPRLIQDLIVFLTGQWSRLSAEKESKILDTLRGKQTG